MCYKFMIGRTNEHSIRESLEENGNQSLKFHIGEKYERVVRSHPLWVSIKNLCHKWTSSSLSKKKRELHPMKKVKIYGILPFDRPLLANHLWWVFLLHRLRGLDLQWVSNNWYPSKLESSKRETERWWEMRMGPSFELAFSRRIKIHMS